MPDQIRLSRTHLARMTEIADAGLPDEACGILSGLDDKVYEVIQIRNNRPSPTTYSLAPEEMIRALWQIEEIGRELLAFFHSHPNSLPAPSLMDVQHHHYPGTPQVILGKSSVPGWQVRAYLLESNRVREIPVEII